jgi:hypothetical protein
LLRAPNRTFGGMEGETRNRSVRACVPHRGAFVYGPHAGCPGATAARERDGEYPVARRSPVATRRPGRWHTSCPSTPMILSSTAVSLAGRRRLRIRAAPSGDQMPPREQPGHRQRHDGCWQGTGGPRQPAGPGHCARGGAHRQHSPAPVRNRGRGAWLGPASLGGDHLHQLHLGAGSKPTIPAGTLAARSDAGRKRPARSVTGERDAGGPAHRRVHRHTPGWCPRIPAITTTRPPVTACGRRASRCRYWLTTSARRRRRPSGSGGCTATIAFPTRRGSWPDGRSTSARGPHASPAHGAEE